MCRCKACGAHYGCSPAPRACPPGSAYHSSGASAVYASCGGVNVTEALHTVAQGTEICCEAHSAPCACAPAPHAALPILQARAHSSQLHSSRFNVKVSQMILQLLLLVTLCALQQWACGFCMLSRVCRSQHSPQSLTWQFAKFARTVSVASKWPLYIAAMPLGGTCCALQP